MKKTVVKGPVSGMIITALLVGLVLSVLASITFGNADISIKEVYQVILYEIFHIDGFSMQKELCMMWYG